MLRTATSRLLLARPPPSLARSRALCTDQALGSALAQVAERIRKADPGAMELPAGVKTPGPKMVLRFTCTNEGLGAPPSGSTVERTQTKTISKKSYQEGACRAASGPTATAAHSASAHAPIMTLLDLAPPRRSGARPMHLLRPTASHRRQPRLVWRQGRQHRAHPCGEGRGGAAHARRGDGGYSRLVCVDRLC